MAKMACLENRFFYSLVMRLNDVPFRTVLKHPKQYRARLARMPMENLRGVVRGRVYRHRGLALGGMKRQTHRQIQRVLTLYENRFGARTQMGQVLQRHIAL